MSGNWVSGGDEDAPADERMEDRGRQRSLEQALETLEQERVASADLNSALIASEARVAAVERRMREAQEAAASSVEEMRAQVAQQAELAEQYRIEAVEAQTMFDAMQHRIDTLSDRLAALKAAAPSQPASAPADDEPAAADVRAEVERLAKLLAERETTLTATRRARDQWLERLEQSGRERERLRERLVEQEKNVAALVSRLAAAEQAGQRVAQLESEIASLRERVREGDAARASAGEQAAEIVRLRSELRSTEEVWERAEADKESLAEELASASQRVSELEESATVEAGRGDAARRAEGEALERARQDTARFESECETLRREAAELRAQIERVEAALVEQAAAREDLQQEIAARTQAEEGTSQRLRELEAAQERGARAEREADEVRARLAVLEEEIAVLRSGRDEAVQRAGALEARLAELDAVGAELASWQGRCADAERVGDGLREELDQARRERAALADEEAGRDEATAALLARLEAISAEQEGARGEQAHLAGETASFGKEVEAFGELLAEVRAQLRDDQGALTQVEERLEADAALRDQLAQEQARRAALEEAQHAASEAGAEERRRLESSDAELARLLEAVAMLEQERDALRGGEEELRAEVAHLRQQSSDGASQGDDLERLRRQIEILEQEREDLVIGHTTEVRGYRDEIARHVEAIGQRESELDRLVGECSSLQDAVDEAIGELEGIRGERASLESRLEAMDGAAVNGLEGLGDVEALVSAAAAAAAATNGDVEADIEEVSKLAADVERGLDGQGPTEGAPYVLLFDSSKDCRHTIETALPTVRGSRCTSDPEQPIPAGMKPVLAFNLAADSVDPLALVAESQRWGIDEPCALVYCVKGDRGVFFGRVEFFPAPCDPKSCAQRLLTRSDGNLQRLLAVGEEVDLMSGLREEMGRNRCSTAIAFDGRQAVDLIPMVKPQMVLVDLNLPRGDGLRVASQIRANPDTAALRVAMFWSKPIDPLVFRQQAIYAMRDFTLAQEELARKFTDTLRHFDVPILGGVIRGARPRPHAAAAH